MQVDGLVDGVAESIAGFQVFGGEPATHASVTEDPSKFIIGTLRKYGRGVTANMGLGKVGSREVCS